MTATQVLHFCASNDRNGNPQRCYVLVDADGNKLAAWDEGYEGHHAVPDVWRDAAYDAERINCSMTWYRKMLRTLPTYPFSL